MVDRTEVRYEVEYSKAFNCWFIQDIYKFEEVCTMDSKEDADIICECLNIIGHDRK